MLTAWKNIAVFLDDSPASSRLGDYAAEIARKHGAHLIGIYGINRAEGENSASSYARGTEALGQVMATQRAANEDRVLLAGRHFSEISKGLDSGAEFRVVWNDRAHHDPVLHSLHSDLVIVGHPKPHGIHQSWTADSLLRMTGIPVLIVPDTRKVETIGEKVLIAWNGGREARRAITDAMPFIVPAKSVTILVVDAHLGSGQFGEEPGADVALHLARHGARVEVTQVESDGASIGEVIASEASKQGSDLIVAGARSHARPTEILFGGITRTLLASLAVPLLLSR